MGRGREGESEVGREEKLSTLGRTRTSGLVTYRVGRAPSKIERVRERGRM